MLINRENLRFHLPWITVSIVITIAATVWYFMAAWGQSYWPGGSSPAGFTFGVAGGLICIFEFLLWPRKKLRGWRIGPAQTWLRAHIWLGLLSVPLVIYHTGFRLGGTLATAVLVLFLIVIVSGVVGLFLQQFLPRRLLEEIPAETIFSQIDYVSSVFADEAHRLVLATCGALGDGDTSNGSRAAEPHSTSHLTIGRMRTVGSVQGKVVQTMVIPSAPVPGSEPLREFHSKHVDPFLRHGKESSPLGARDRSSVMFRDLRGRLDPESHGVVDELEQLCEQRRQFGRQARLHRWLHTWLWIHLPLSMALIVLLLVHIFEALKW